jgi:ketosteroid isomerase-like protein
MFAWIICLILSTTMTNSTPARDVSQELYSRDQALLDAFAPGDVKVWDQALAANAVYVDENGQVMTRAEFLAQLQPLPKGASGTITISKYSASVSGDVATVVHTDDETEDYHGQHLAAQYLTTETWQLQQGAWKLLQVHAYAVLHEPKPIALPAAELDAYVGRYSAAPDLIYTIQREGDHLVGGREGRTPAPLLAEAPEVFFVSGQLRVRKIFQRDERGKVAGFVDRREGEDLVWKRIR